MEEEAEEPTALELGNLIHKTLYLFWERHQEGPLPLIEDAQQEIVEIAESSFKDEGQELPALLPNSFASSFVKISKRYQMVFARVFRKTLRRSKNLLVVSEQ